MAVIHGGKGTALRGHGLRRDNLRSRHTERAHSKNQEGSHMTKAKWLLLNALCLPLSIAAVHAAVNPDKLPQVSCTDIKFSAAFLAKYPKAPQACLDGRQYKGVT